MRDIRMLFQIMFHTRNWYKYVQVWLRILSRVKLEINGIWLRNCGRQKGVSSVRSLVSVFCVRLHPVSKVLLQVAWGCTNIGLPDRLLQAAAVHEHVLLSGMAVVITEHLCIHTHTQTHIDWIKVGIKDGYNVCYTSYHKTFGIQTVKLKNILENIKYIWQTNDVTVKNRNCYTSC